MAVGQGAREAGERQHEPGPPREAMRPHVRAANEARHSRHLPLGGGRTLVAGAPARVAPIAGTSAGSVPRTAAGEEHARRCNAYRPKHMHAAYIP